MIVPVEDFWSRQANAQGYSFECAAYGAPARITANQPQALGAARLSARRYSAASSASGQPIHIQIVAGRPAGAPSPDDLQERLRYSGVGEWITLSAGEWGHSFANLQTRTACVFLSEELSRDIPFVSRYFVDHYVLNFVLTEWAMLHASCVLDAERRRLIILVAAHDTGKSTTALQLTRAGYTFLADGMALLRRQGDGLIAGGYPIGEVKLRDDVLAWFPEYAGEAVRVREHRKTIVDLRAAHPGRIVESLIAPEAIDLCFVERHEGGRTEVKPIDVGEAARIVAANTVYWNDAAQLAHNSAALHHLLQIARLRRLHLGADPDGILAAIDQLS